jgi:hypothetical protein
MVPFTKTPQGTRITLKQIKHHKAAVKGAANEVMSLNSIMLKTLKKKKPVHLSSVAGMGAGRGVFDIELRNPTWKIWCKDCFKPSSSM